MHWTFDKLLIYILSYSLEIDSSNMPKDKKYNL